MEQPLNWNSRRLTAGDQEGVKAFYWGLEWTAEDFEKPQIGIGLPILDVNLCNRHTPELGEQIKIGLRAAGMHGFCFGVPSISDNITQGHEGGNASLPSRNMIASGAEAVVGSHAYDGMIGLHMCDKNGPGFAMALARLNFPGFLMSGGTIKPGCLDGKAITILDVYDAQASAQVGDITPEKRDLVIRNACPGAGGCGIAASFNTWGIAMEAIGLMLPGSASMPAVDDIKREECRTAGKCMERLLRENIRPRDILTYEAFENAVTAIGAIGGSTNGILHILALAREAGVDFGLEDIQAIMRKTPVYCNFAPRGKGTMIDLYRLGGTPALLKVLWKAGLLNGDCLTITGDPLSHTLESAKDIAEDQSLVAPIGSPFKEFADIQICFGNLAPDGIVFKVSSRQDPRFSGEAICFDEADDIVKAVESKRIRPGHAIILRNQGPVARGMPEVLVATSALSVPELDGKVAFLSDTRISGVSHGAIGVHCAPEAAVGGPIGLVEDGDSIVFDLLKGSIEWGGKGNAAAVSASDTGKGRRAGLPAYLSEFSRTVSQANHGCSSQI